MTIDIVTAIAINNKFLQRRMTKVSMNASTQPSILWLQVCGLAAVQGAIALTWVIYNLYLAKLLTQFGFPQGLATVLLIIESVLAIVIEPLVGGLSDEMQRWIGSRFPFIAVGVVLASAFFIAIPAVVIFGSPVGGMRWQLPMVMVAWALAMTIFRSPALSLLGRYAFATKLPQAASVLTLVGALAGAMGPLANQFILSLGPAITFTTGSIVLLAAAAILRAVNPQASTTSSEISASTRTQRVSILNLGLIFGTAAGVTLGFRLIMETWPKVLKTQLTANAGLMIGLFFVTLAITAIPAGTLAVRLGNRRAMIIGLGAMACFSGLIFFSHSVIIAVGVAIVLAASFSLIANGALPFALALVPADKAGLGIGIYSSGGAMASALFGFVLSRSGIISPITGILTGAIAFLAAGVCVAVSRRVVANTDG